MMVERLPRQPGRFRRLFDRRTPKTLAAEHQHGGVEDAVAGLHLTILTKYDEMSNDGFVWRGQATGPRAAAVPRGPNRASQFIGSTASEQSADHAAHRAADH